MEDDEFTNLLARASYFLSIRDHSNCRIHALTALNFRPDHPSPTQLLAICGVLLAANRRLPDGRMDWYSILQTLEHDNIPEQKQQVDDNPSVLRRQFAKLIHILNPSKNTYPFSRDALQLVFDAWGVLSNSEKKAQYDIGKDCHNGSYVFDDINTFWTICPYCYYVYEYDVLYKECCLKCQNCSRGFHSAEISSPPPDCLVKVDGGVEGYKCRFGYFGVKYKGGESESMNKKKIKSVVVEISDDDDEEVNVVEEINVEKARVSGGVGNEVEKKKRVKKAVGWNCTKILGRGVRYGVDTEAMMRELSKDNKEDGCGGESKVGDECGGEGTGKEAMSSGSGDGDGVDDILEFDLEGDDIFVSM